MSLQQRIKEQADAIQENLNKKRVVAWLDREDKLKLYDEICRNEYHATLHKEKLKLEALVEDSTWGVVNVKKMKKELQTVCNVGRSRF